jgi:hypothetical protein
MKCSSVSRPLLSRMLFDFQKSSSAAACFRGFYFFVCGGRHTELSVLTSTKLRAATAN